jgi:hypothetical protein
MRPLWVFAIIVCGAFALATVASASMRDEVRSVAAAAADVVTPGDEASPSPAASPAEPSPEPSDSATPVLTPEPSVTAVAGEDGGASGEHADNHGAAVSAVAKDKNAVATKTTPSGKTVTNHGQAVSAVARSNAGKPDKGGNGGGNGKD